ncbi:tripartite tricarboxylate transporter substrate-binding protein [Pollutimonas sp. H1-120]|uniref:Bug family tripartite tricarboxylate transporter substrate binding protein n=1 Tax=Pollutimonas sp. H1-120 TaxID=3148824 RepID=UPI003B526176
MSCKFQYETPARRASGLLCRSLLTLMLGLGLPAIGTAAESVDAFPSKPIKLVVPFSAGGGIDMMARIAAQKMSEYLGQNIVVQNQGGGGGVVASRGAVQAPPDGYNLIFHSVSSAVVNATVDRNLGYDPIGGFTPVSLVAQFPLVMIIDPNLPAKNMAEFIALLKANPKQYSYGSSGIGSGIHLAAELFRKLAGVEIQHVPYKGTSSALADVLGGRLAMLIDGVPPEMGNIRAGKVRALAVTTTERSEVLPDVPTMAEAGLAGYDIPFWVAIYAPAGTPKPIVDKLSKAVSYAMHDPEAVARLKAAGAVGVGSSPEELDAFWKKQLALYSDLVKSSGIDLDSNR